jgi:hypothetical protein
MKDEEGWLDFFAGGVPTPRYFQMTLEDIDGIAHTCPASDGINRQLELCYVGLHCYFEAFLKEHFASILNIMPELLIRLREHSIDTSVDAVRVHLFADRLRSRLGFLVAEKLDFGTPRKVNAHFSTLLQITPIGKQDAERLEESLSIRNQIVHHGGTITSRFAEQVLKDSKLMDVAFWESITLTHDMHEETSRLISNLARGVAVSSMKAAKEYATKNSIILSAPRMEALEAFAWWEEEEANEVPEPNAHRKGHPTR